MRIDSKIASSTVNGPGDRSVIWVNGCTLKCAGCWNEHTHAIDPDKRDNKVFQWIVDIAKDGVTFSGGEPLQQMYWMELLTRNLRRVRPELSIGVYTGYTLKELDSGNIETYYSDGGKRHSCKHELIEEWNRVKQYLDFAIMGRFNQQQLDTSRPYCSSRNQEIVLFSDRYTLDDFKQQEIEFQIDENGLVQITGFPVGLTSIQDLSAFEIERNW